MKSLRSWQTLHYRVMPQKSILWRSLFRTNRRSSKRYRAISQSLGIFFRITRYLLGNKSDTFCVISIRSVFRKRNPPTSEDRTKGETTLNYGKQTVAVRSYGTQDECRSSGRKDRAGCPPYGQASCRFPQFLRACGEVHHVQPSGSGSRVELRHRNRPRHRGKRRHRGVW